MRYFLHIAYDGSDFSGWQRQLDAHSIQEEIEINLEKIFKKAITVIGCGRTDAGVHASQYVFHIDIDQAFDFDLKFRLNKNLPDAIAVYAIQEVDQNRHSRYDAISRSYDYFIHRYKDPVLNKYSSFYEFDKLDLASMKKAASILVNYNDYRSFCKQPDLYENTSCVVTESGLFISSDKQRMRFAISANRFLRGMIRLLVSYLLKVGTGEMNYKEFEEMLQNPKEPLNKVPALPNGLFLSKVEYPFIQFEQPINMCSLLKQGLV